MRIEIPATRDHNYTPKSLVEHAYEHGKKVAAEEFVKYLRKMAMTQDYIAYDCYVAAKDWAEKTFGITASADCSTQNNEDPHPEYQEYVEMVDGILAEEKKRL